MLQILHKLDVSNQLIKWVVELSEFDIKFAPIRKIKGKAFADFIIELTPKIKEASEGTRTVFVDKSARQTGNSVGIVLISPSGQRKEHVVRFSFSTTNNGDKHKALLAGIKITNMVGTTTVKLCMDLQLVA